MSEDYIKKHTILCPPTQSTLSNVDEKMRQQINKRQDIRKAYIDRDLVPWPKFSWDQKSYIIVKKSR